MSNGYTPPELSTGSKAVALIAGPTASGKSDLAVALAQELARRGSRGVIVNADSAQVYRDLRILSARPSDADMDGIEHRLFGTWDGAQACSAAEWASAATREIDAAHAADAVPIVVGGTGLYLRTLLDGIAPVPPIDPAVRDAVRALPTHDAYAALKLEDPQRAAQLNPADSARIARALEVVRATGMPLAYWHRQKVGGVLDRIVLHPVVLIPDREWLYARCDTRFSAMVDAGAVGEVEALLARGLPPTLPVMRAIGVPEIAGWLGGAWSRDVAIAKGQQATRNYAKRQYTWLRGQSPEGWSRVLTSSIPAQPIEILFRSLLLT